MSQYTEDALVQQTTAKLPGEAGLAVGLRPTTMRISAPAAFWAGAQTRRRS